MSFIDVLDLDALSTYIDKNAHILGWRVLRSIGQVDFEVVGDQTKAESNCTSI